MVMNFLWSTAFWTSAGVSVALGYLIFWILAYLLPKRLKADNIQQREMILRRAKTKVDQIIVESKSRYDEQLNLYTEELELNFTDEQSNLKITNDELDSQESSLNQLEVRLLKDEKDLQALQAKVGVLTEKYSQEIQVVKQSRNELQMRLEIIAECDSNDIRKTLHDDIINERQLEAQRLLMDLTEQIQTHSKKSASRILSRVLSRYSPKLVWPKAINHIDLNNPKVAEMFKLGKVEILEELSQLSEGVEITLINDHETNNPILKLGGGYGIYREAVKLTLDELVSKGTGTWSKAAKIYERHRMVLDKIALKMGKQALTQLRLTGVHEEIAKMIGALNWRTSYRQNQYYHSLEVAELSGILANEFNEDSDAAKRCGLLHDIGKGLDYKIEGSHAIISADYADRYGETKFICDTIMSHHNDIVLETPQSYLLKTADTLSGARPGARVHLEEGYQIRLTAIDQSIRSFPGIQKVAIMSGGREVHVDVNPKKVKEHELEILTKDIVKKIETDVAFPGQIKVVVTRRYEAVAVA